jgi:hypothetical protein
VQARQENLLGVTVHGDDAFDSIRSSGGTLKLSEAGGPKLAGEEMKGIK